MLGWPQGSSGFSTLPYGKTQTDLLASPVKGKIVLGMEGEIKRDPRRSKQKEYCPQINRRLNRKVFKSGNSEEIKGFERMREVGTRQKRPNMCLDTGVPRGENQIQ